MSANFQQYSLIFVGVNGALLAEEGEVSMKRASNAKIVETVAKGLAGLSPGAPMAQGRVMSSMPAATGLEYDAGPVIISLTVVQLKLVRSDGKGCTFPAFILDDDTSHGVGKSAAYDFSYIGAFPTWQ